MLLDIYFTEQEQVDYLTKLGYQIIDHPFEKWRQIGHNDNCGEWSYFTLKCAVKPDTVNITEDLEYTKIFKKEISTKVHDLLLS